MKKNGIALALLLALSTLQSKAQEKAPLLRGKVDISIRNGTMVCDFVLSDIPKIPDYYIRINTGMNIRYIRNKEDNYNYGYERDYNDTTRYESFGYYIPDNTGKSKLIKDTYRFSYVGKFPVIADTTMASNTGDWKGNIAFNGSTVRTDGRQSAWYPVFYNKTTDKMYDKVRYDIQINCSDCSAIYLNGNSPVQGKQAHFKSDDPKDLMLFAGNYKVFNEDGTYFLNPDISKAQMKEFGVMTKNFKSFYEKKLGIPYKYKITYLQTTPISKDNAWLFVSYPTIVNVGWGKYGMKGFFDKKNGDWFRPYMAHELGHYYFGNYKAFNSALGVMMGEGFTEYMSLQVIKDFFKDSIYTAKINEKIKKLKEFKPLPFSKIKNEKDYGSHELYVYNFAPLVFVAIEKEIGDDKMWKWLDNILETKTEFTDYNFLLQTLSATLNNDDKVQAIKHKYFESDISLENAINTINNK